MKSSSNKQQKHSEEASETMDQSESASTARLPNEVLLMIFRFLDEGQLLTAEQVCLRWKALADVCFATKRTLMLTEFNELDFKKVKRYGPSLKSLDLSFCVDDNIDLMAEIGDAFPNLLSISLFDVPIRSESFRVLPVKCSRLTRISLAHVNEAVTDEDLRVVLKGLPRLKRLRLSCFDLKECFADMGSSLEYLSLVSVSISPTGMLHLFSRCTNLQTLKIEYKFECDARVFAKFCKNSSLRRLCLEESGLSKEWYLAISRLSLLEKLELTDCSEVDSEVLRKISFGCPNLKEVSLYKLPLVCDRGVRCLARCRRLTKLECGLSETVTDESLFRFANAGILETLRIGSCAITDRGLSAILARCPRLQHLNVYGCRRVGDSTVDAAVAAVESRARRLSATRNQSPHVESTAIVPSNKTAKSSDYLLRLFMSGQELERYRVGFSHPLLHLHIN